MRTKEERKKSPEEPSRAKTPTRERGKSDSRGENSQGKSERQQEGKTKGKGENHLKTLLHCSSFLHYVVDESQTDTVI